jgi:hypothetical protein
MSQERSLTDVSSLDNGEVGRDGGIRTHDLVVPNDALYQAEPHPEGKRDATKNKLEPLTRIEPVTSSLPKKCSAAELQRLSKRR